ncbi:MAG: galactose mutarotase [Lachnospiraceae bacterium]|nr:galactose mutarotase [Lachnospiraceae bacterium]
MDKSFWGRTQDDDDVYRYTIKGKKGIAAVVTNYGAILTELYVPVQGGGTRDIALGYRRLEDYFENNPNFGATIGRHANRIGGAAFDLNGKHYELAKNDNDKNNLHSGPDGYHKRVWEVTDETDYSITFHLDSPDMDQGYPGNLGIDVTYTVTDDNALIIDYHGISDADTIFNPTNHSYFNLNGHDAGSILDHILSLEADEFTYADEYSIPDGTVRDVTGTPMDFREPTALGDRIDTDYDVLNFAGGYDHNYILNRDDGLRTPSFDDNGLTLYHAASVTTPSKDITMEVYTDLPGIQLYAGNYITSSEVGKDGKNYDKRYGFCLETQYYPNAINIPSFPQPVIKAGEDRFTRTVYKF